MARIANINPAAAAALTAMATEMRDREVARGLAHTALQRTAMAHKIGVAKAKDQHKRRPLVTLA